MITAKRPLTEGNDMKKIVVLDSTLRDGAQALGISFTVEDKLKIVKQLDRLGVAYIEAGNPGSNPKDLEFFEQASRLKLKHSRLIAFGSTRKAGIPVEEDANVKSMLKAAPMRWSYSKSWDFQVTEILKTNLEENLRMITDTVGFSGSMAKK